MNVSAEPFFSQRDSYRLLKRKSRRPSRRLRPNCRQQPHDDQDAQSADTDDATLQRMFDLNLNCVFHILRAAVPLCERRAPVTSLRLEAEHDGTSHYLLFEVVPDSFPEESGNMQSHRTAQL